MVKGKVLTIVRNAYSTDNMAILKICKDVLKTINNKAFFNWSDEVLKQELTHVQTLIAEIDGVVVSFLCYRDLLDVLEISVLATQPNTQNLSYQTQIISHLKVIAAKRRASIILEVHSQNIKALSLYLKMGFVLLHTRKQYYSDKADALVMGWECDKAYC